MKYLKSFEAKSFSKMSKNPTQIEQSYFYQKLKSYRKEYFEKYEHQLLIDLMEDSGREHMSDDEWENLGWSQKIDNFQIGLTYLTFYIKSFDGNPHPIEVHLTKLEDYWYLVSLYQENWDGDEGYFDGYEKYYECTGFDQMMDFLERKIHEPQNESVDTSKPILFYDNNKIKGEELTKGISNNPKQFNFYMERKEPWYDFEKDSLISFAKQNREKINSYSFDTSITSDMDIFIIIVNDQDTSNESDALKEIYCHKCEDNVYLVQEFLLDPNLDKRYYCGGFDILLELLENLL